MILAVLLIAATTKISASVADDLSTVRVHVETGPGELIFAGDRYGRLPPKLRASTARELFMGGFELGGFRDVAVEPCPHAKTSTLAGGERTISCGDASRLSVDAVLAVPDRYGTFARHSGMLVLAAGWYPYVAGRGPVEVSVEIPADHGAVIGRRWFPPVPSGARRRLEVSIAETMQVPLVVVPPSAAPIQIDEGRAVYIARSRARAASPHAEQMLIALRDGIAFMREEGLEVGSPLLVVESPMRHELAAATDGPVLASDRAFRIFPAHRFYRFHRFPILREMYTAWALERLEDHVVADAVGAWLVDRYVKSRFGSRENAFDVLGFLSFIPSIDSMLYAPDLPFVGAYFRLIEENDPLAPNLISFPSAMPRGKIVYEKLLDRIGADATDRVMNALLSGTALEAAVVRELPDAKAFLKTWLGPYPDVRYKLGEHSTEPAPASECGDRMPCFRAKIAVHRDGDAIAEPTFVRFTADDGSERVVKSEATSEPIRIVTATLTAPLELAELDPFGRLAERPNALDPSPRYDNRTSPRWKLLLNNFNIQLLATEKSIDTALDLGIARVHDVKWSYAVRADYDPAAIALSGRATYSFGGAVTPARLAHWAGLIVEGAYLRQDFGQQSGDCAALGELSPAFALSAALTYGFDDRESVWAPQTGSGLRAALEYNHVFGELAECNDGIVSSVSPDSLSASIRALQQWKLGGRHQISLRGKVGSYLAGSPREQLLFRLGGRTNVRGYASGALQGRLQAIASAEWLHMLLPELDENAFEATWASGLDGAFFADAALMGDGLDALGSTVAFADAGYGFRVYIDYFGVRPGVMAIDIAFPLFDVEGRAKVGPPAVYIDFSQSFLAF